MKIVIVSGGFDPIHSGHISYLKSAKKLGDKLIVALNSDAWLQQKKDKFFMPFNERKIIIENLYFVDDVIGFEDDEFGSAINALESIKNLYPSSEIIFANGGDRNKDNIPEMAVSGIEFLFGVGGDNKRNSSSWILKKWKYFQEERVWGSYYNLFKDDDVKKSLNPSNSLIEVMILLLDFPKTVESCEEILSYSFPATTSSSFCPAISVK